MNTNLDRSLLERPVLVYRLDVAPSIDSLVAKVIDALKSLNRAALVSSSGEETKALLASADEPELIIFVAVTAGNALLQAMQTTRQFEKGKNQPQIAFVGGMDEEANSSLYDSGVDHVLPLNLKADTVLHRIQKILHPHKALQTIKADQAQIRKVLDVCPAFVWLLKTPKQWAYLNHAASEFVGGGRGSNWSASVHPEDMGTLIKTLESAWIAPFHSSCEVRVLTASGQTRSVQHSFTALVGDNEKPEMIVGSGIDVTEFRTAEKIFNDRQRYMTAYTLIQKLFGNSTEAASQLATFTAITSQALDVRKTEVFVLDSPNVLTTLRDPSTAEGTPADALFLARLQAVPDHMEKLLREEPSTVSIGTEHVSIFSIVKEARVLGLLAISHHPRVKFGRFELDFIKNIKSVIASVRNW